MTKYIKDNPIKTIASITILIATIAISISIAIIVSTNQELSKHELSKEEIWCFSNNCIESILNNYSSIGKIIDAAIKFSALVTAIISIVIALSSYLNSSKFNALSNHISHLSTFSHYVNQEAQKLQKIDQKSINSFKWYNEIFKNSRNGLLDISEQYKIKILDIDNQIKKSNTLFKSKKVEEFRYRDHQKRIINSIKEIGIEICTSPRVDFNEVEEDVFLLISRVNDEFCYSADALNLTKREYK